MASLSSPNQWLTAWLANNPFAPHLGLGISATGSKNSESHDEDDMVQYRFSRKITTFQKDDRESEMDDVLEIETTEEDLKEEELASHSPTVLLVHLQNKRTVSVNYCEVRKRR